MPMDGLWRVSKAGSGVLSCVEQAGSRGGHFHLDLIRVRTLAMVSIDCRNHVIIRLARLNGSVPIRRAGYRRRIQLRVSTQPLLAVWKPVARPAPSQRGPQRGPLSDSTTTAWLARCY